MPDAPDPAAVTMQRTTTHRPDSSDGMPHQVGSHVICTRADGFIMFDDYTIREKRVRNADALLDYAAERLTEARDGRYWINVLNDPALSGIRELVVSQAGFPGNGDTYIAWSTDPAVGPMFEPVRKLRAAFAALDGQSYDYLDDAAVVDLAATRLHHSDDDRQRRATFWGEATRILEMEGSAQRGVRDRVLAILREREAPTLAQRQAADTAEMAARHRREREALAVELADPAVTPPQWVETGRDAPPDPVVEGLSAVLDELRGLRAQVGERHVDAMQHLSWCVEESLAATIERAVDGAATHVADAIRETGENTADVLVDAVMMSAPPRRRDGIDAVRHYRWATDPQRATQGREGAAGDVD